MECLGKFYNDQNSIDNMKEIIIEIWDENFNHRLSDYSELGNFCFWLINREYFC